MMVCAVCSAKVECECGFMYAGHRHHVDLATWRNNLVCVLPSGGRHCHVGHAIASARLAAYGIRGEAEDVGFIHRTLDVYFRGKPWHFLLERKAQLRHEKRHFNPGTSVVVHRHGLHVHCSRRFPWVAGALAPLKQMLGRLHLRLSAIPEESEWDAPGAVHKLKALPKSSDMRSTLLRYTSRYEPDKVDSRVVQARLPQA